MKEIHQLLDDLKHEDPQVRQKATAALWLKWHGEAGEEAGNRLQEGVQFINSEKLDLAEQVFFELTQDYPDFPEGHNKLATVLFLQENYDQSIEECDTTLKLNPHHFGAWNGKGMCYYQIGKYNEAIACFQKALEIQPYANANRTYIARCRGKLN